jgi:hypothetical protein
MQIGSKGIENLLVTMVLERKEENSEKTQIWKDTFPFLFTWGLANQILVWNYPKHNFWNCPKDDLLNIKLS